MPVKQRDSCLTVLCRQHYGAGVVIVTKKWTFTGAADFAHVVVLLHSYNAQPEQLRLS